MTDIDTKELRRLMEEATEGRWRCEALSDGTWSIFAEESDERICVIEPWSPTADAADAALIVAMHNALPALLSEAEEAARLREQITRLQKAVERGREFAGTLPARVSAALLDAQKRLRGGGMLGGDNDPVNAALQGRDRDAN